MEKLKLFLRDAEGIDLYPYFENMLYPEKYTGKLPELSYEENETYCLSLPLLLVSPRIYLRDARFAVALGMERELFASLCRGVSAIAVKGAEIPNVPTAVFRDDLILKSVTGEGLRGVSALRYLCDCYLDGLTLREDSVISAVRVDCKTVMALTMEKEAFLNDPVRAAYASVFSRAVRLVRVCILNAPDIIVRNEIMLLHKALEKLSEIALFDME